MPGPPVICNSEFYILLRGCCTEGEATDNVAATPLWNGLFGVDTFFVIGGCLLAFHTMKEMDKTKGGNRVMWLMFYVHRYIRLTGV